MITWFDLLTIPTNYSLSCATFNPPESESYCGGWSKDGIKNHCGGSGCGISRNYGYSKC